MELFAVMSVQDWLLIVAGIGIAVERIIDRVKSSERNTAAIKQRDVAEAKVEITVAKVAEIAKVADATHVLVNSQHGVALRSSAAALRRVADLTGEKKDAALAEEAEKLRDEHESKQNKVDRGETTPL